MELRLREILKERSLSLKAFADISGISQPNLSNYLNGNVSPTLDTLKRMAKCLDIEVADLFRSGEALEFYVKYQGRFYNITTTDIINIIKLKKSYE